MERVEVEQAAGERHALSGIAHCFDDPADGDDAFQRWLAGADQQPVIAARTSTPGCCRRLPELAAAGGQSRPHKRIFHNVFSEVVSN
jgi:hypothetical protein